MNEHQRQFPQQTQPNDRTICVGLVGWLGRLVGVMNCLVALLLGWSIGLFRLVGVVVAGLVRWWLVVG